MKEAYRTQKHCLPVAEAQEAGQALSYIGFVFVGKPETDFKPLQGSMKKALLKVQKEK
jgi:hypothetical protein